MKKYYSMATENGEANINIYGDITSWEWLESDVSSYTLSKELDSLGMELTQSMSYKFLWWRSCRGISNLQCIKRHKAKIKTYCDGFAASIASVIFMAGDERIMSNASLLFIHNAWTYTGGNANELRKTADDLETMTQASINAYMDHVNITEEELKEMLDAETWITPQDALTMGFATSIINDSTNKNPNQSIKKQVMKQLTKPVETPQETPTPPAEEPAEPEENKTQNLIAALFR